MYKSAKEEGPTKKKANSEEIKIQSNKPTKKEAPEKGRENQEKKIKMFNGD